ncbi:hypothetical protein AG1IA_10378 [Rhizoctonia solani AG-1 IA]|uniref:Uncharacterized protein n=1 Tax=Thanatephorus cucumeris (strain AG1-IA) TaxID=983506 RepID=L8WFU5_THACA|nr:hypothetical protein AG1IA_10378 [Rhizoctonia solani AG-1 IA]
MISTCMKAVQVCRLSGGNEGSTEQIIHSSRVYSSKCRESPEAKMVGSRRRCTSISSFIRGRGTTGGTSGFGGSVPYDHCANT